MVTKERTAGVWYTRYCNQETHSPTIVVTHSPLCISIKSPHPPFPSTLRPSITLPARCSYRMPPRALSTLIFTNATPFTHEQISLDLRTQSIFMQKYAGNRTGSLKRLGGRGTEVRSTEKELRNVQGSKRNCDAMNRGPVTNALIAAEDRQSIRGHSHPVKLDVKR